MLHLRFEGTAIVNCRETFCCWSVFIMCKKWHESIIFSGYAVSKIGREREKTLQYHDITITFFLFGVVVVVGEENWPHLISIQCEGNRAKLNSWIKKKWHKNLKQDQNIPYSNSFKEKKPLSPVCLHKT